jgi:hypothetical protein
MGKGLWVLPHFLFTKATDFFRYKVFATGFLRFCERSKMSFASFKLANGLLLSSDPGRITCVILVWTEVKKAGRRCRDRLFAFLRTFKMSFASFKTQKGHSPIGERPASL